VLSISVEQTSLNDPQERNFNKQEFSYSSFVRSFTLPESADENGIEAKYENGVLCIDINDIPLFVRGTGNFKERQQ